jgi:large subunit ribosomal protein L10
MPTPKKIDQAAKIEKVVAASGAVYFADLSRLTAQRLSELRRKLRKDKIRLLGVKNRLALRALAAGGVPGELRPILRGPTTLVLGDAAEPYAPARMLRDLSGRTKEWTFKGAFVEQTLFTAEQFDTLSAMPTRTELYGQLVGVLSGPTYGLVATLENLIAGLVFTLDELKTRREQEPATEPAQ